MYVENFLVGALRPHSVDYGCTSTVKNKSSIRKMKLISISKQILFLTLSEPAIYAIFSAVMYMRRYYIPQSRGDIYYE